MTDYTGNDGWQGLQLGFVPINQAESPPESKRRRAYLSCERCRKRKTRCEPASDQKQPFSRRNDTDTDDGIPSLTPLASRDVPVRPIEREYVDYIPVTDSSQGPRSPTALDARTRIISTHISNASDALDLLTFAASGTHAYNDRSATPSRESHVPSITSPTGISDMALTRERAWKNFSLLRKGIVSQQEVMDYLGFFFDHLWPLKPVIPSFYRDRATYGQLVTEEPLLVICLVTLSSRYFPLPGDHGEIRSERIHWQAWRILQRSLQSVMWGSTTTRSLGAIASMLLLIDWHVKAINNPSDFTEGEDEVHGHAESHGLKVSSNTDSFTGQRRYGMVSLMERLNIVSPAYRSNKMSWSLLSNAIALAHEGCCFQNESSSSRFSHSNLDSVRKEWNGLLCVFLYIADEGLATRLGLEPLLPEKSRQIVKDRFATTFAESLPDSHLWEGYFELSIETRKGRDFLLSLKSRDGSFSNLDLVPHLERLRRGLHRWKRQYYNQDGNFNKDQRLHIGSPDDSHMAIRYAKFLGIMVQIAVPAASSSSNGASKTGPVEDSNGTEHQVRDGIEEVAYPYTFNDVAVEGISDWNALLDLDLAPDLFMWWESMHN
ncbi:ARO80-positive transcription regulator of ARO9 ARO10 [Fusarium coicis]|nr:ARO80-positive transcription regulator of ARO9 ARO10 [Fusarium coicis]